DASYRTVARVGTSETLVERSRFIGRAHPVRSLAEAEAIVAALRKEHYDSRHVCYGLKIGRGAVGLDRSNDDGEPAKTGGYPLWQLLEGDDVTDTVIAVVRYFGGVKLGMGGLSRAYREAGRTALAGAGVEERWPESAFHLTVRYDQVDRVNYLLGPLNGVRTEDTAYAGDVRYTLAVRKLDVPDVCERLAVLLQRDPSDVLSATAELPLC
ncbi:MAG: putative YigZ family protein, partial [Bradymonadia bacterium]